MSLTLPLQKKAFLSHVLFNKVRGQVDDLFIELDNPHLHIFDNRRVLLQFSEMDSMQELMANWVSFELNTELATHIIGVELAYNGAVYSSEQPDHVNLAICLYNNSSESWPIYIAPIKDDAPPDNSSDEWQQYIPKVNQVIIWDSSTHWTRRDPFVGECHVTLNMNFRKV